MSSVNKAIVVGTLGRDPEVKSLQNGSKICNLSVATSERWRDKQSGEQKEKTEWHRVTIWNEGLVGIAERFLRKGSKVYLEGQLETRKYTDSSGAERFTTEIVLKAYRGELVMLGDPKGSRDDDGGGRSGGKAAPATYAPDLDDEIPF